MAGEAKAAYEVTLRWAFRAGTRERGRALDVCKALGPEAERGLPGASVEVRTVSGGRVLMVRIRAQSLRDLRAASNSYLRWANLAVDVADRARVEERDA